MKDSAGGSGQTQWICARCNMELTPARVRVSYLGSSFSIELPVCPKCGTALVDEEVALNRMAEAEKVLEDK